MQAIVVRARRYLHFIVDEVERRGLPTELALLPFVESGFNPMALSSAQASGLWQFIPETGAKYNLAQNTLYDGRRDVVASTGAALDYLEFLYQYNDHDWPRALASYNWGESAVARAVERNRAREFALRICRTFQSGICVSELKMRVGFIGALRDIFLEGIERRREIHFVDGVIRLLQQWRERIFLPLRRTCPASTCLSRRRKKSLP